MHVLDAVTLQADRAGMAKGKVSSLVRGNGNGEPHLPDDDDLLGMTAHMPGEVRPSPAFAIPGASRDDTSSATSSAPSPASR